MKLYGLRGYSHGGASLLTVMSAAGRQAVVDYLEPDPARVHVLTFETGLPQYHEMVSGGLADLVARYDVEVLDFHAWSRKKAELGSSVYR